MISDATWASLFQAQLASQIERLDEDEEERAEVLGNMRTHNTLREAEAQSIFAPVLVCPHNRRAPLEIVLQFRVWEAFERYNAAQRGEVPVGIECSNCGTTWQGAISGETKSLICPNCRSREGTILPRRHALA